MKKENSELISGYTFDELVKKIEDFHGHLAPGLIIGAFLVHLARENLPKGEFFDVICETGNCLPDAVQMLTPCTVGNGWLKIINVGRFALTFYDKYSGTGVRVYMDPGKLDAWPAIKNWFMKLVPKKDQDLQELLDAISSAGADILSFQEVSIDPGFLGKKGSGKISICPSCKEAYPAKFGDLCGGCNGELPYMKK